MLAKAYQKYLYIPRPVSKRYPMDVQHRAKQFAPFAALRGFEEIVRKQEILYEQRKVLSEEQKCGLDRMEINQTKVASNHRLVSYSDYADDRILLLDPASDFLDQYIEKEMVRDFLGCLTARQKEIIQLFYFEEMNQEKIADYLGIRQQSVCEMMQRALSVMKKHADKEEN